MLSKSRRDCALVWPLARPVGFLRETDPFSPTRSSSTLTSGTPRSSRYLAMAAIRQAVTPPPQHNTTQLGSASPQSGNKELRRAASCSARHQLSRRRGRRTLNTRLPPPIERLGREVRGMLSVVRGPLGLAFPRNNEAESSGMAPTENDWNLRGRQCTR